VGQFLGTAGMAEKAGIMVDGKRKGCIEQSVYRVSRSPMFYGYTPSWKEAT